MEPMHFGPFYKVAWGSVRSDESALKFKCIAEALNKLLEMEGIEHSNCDAWTQRLPETIKEASINETCHRLSAVLLLSAIAYMVSQTCLCRGSGSSGDLAFLKIQMGLIVSSISASKVAAKCLEYAIGNNSMAEVVRANFCSP